jgi:hypothetical protein
MVAKTMKKTKMKATKMKTKGYKCEDHEDEGYEGCGSHKVCIDKKQNMYTYSFSLGTDIEPELDLE